MLTLKIIIKYKLRTIQDNSYKYGTGSYSRIISNVNTDTLNEELKNGQKNNVNVNASLQLPNISRNKKNNEITNLKFKKNNHTLNHNYEAMNSISEELEKRYVNPDNLIRASNKIAEVKK